jgi:hypothetical protein
MPDCYDVYLWSIGELHLPPSIEEKIVNEMILTKINYKITGENI